VWWLFGRVSAVVSGVGEAYPVAWWVKFNAGHERAHECDAAAAGALEVFIGGAIGDAFGVEAGALVGDVKLHALGVDAHIDGDGFLGVILIAVLERVGDGFLKGESDAELCRFAVLELPDDVEHALFDVVRIVDAIAEDVACFVAIG